MNITPEVQAQLDEQSKQCIFCRLIRGEIPAKKVFEDEKTVAMVDIHPAVKGHCTFMLNGHYPLPAYIPGDEFSRLFGLVPQFCKATAKAMVAPAMNIFIASGGAAGQQAPHFMMHVLPRESGDGFFNFFWKGKVTLGEDSRNMLAHNFPLMMANHFKRHPAAWHTGAGNVPSFLAEIYEKGQVIYEDEKSLVVVPEAQVCEGYIQVYSKEEEKEIGELSIESGAHLFFVASFAATALFEGLGAQGTNIIMKSGVSDDNAGGRLCLHVLSRKMDDNLQSMHWTPKQPEYNVDDVAKKIKDATWKVTYSESNEKLVVEKKEKKVEMPKMVLGGQKKNSRGDALQEIQEAIKRYQR